MSTSKYDIEHLRIEQDNLQVALKKNGYTRKQIRAKIGETRVRSESQKPIE